jgi:hypothetical protein
VRGAAVKPCFYSDTACEDMSARLSKSGREWLSENLRFWEADGVKASPTG